MPQKSTQHEPGLDDIAAFNRARWEALVAADVLYSRPDLDLDATQARAAIDPFDLLGDVTGKEVLCLAAGGGQQSAAFGVLGANVTVVDITAGQLAKDRLAADHYGYAVNLVQADMRDLSMFGDKAFDIVWHAFSITFIPDPRPVFAEVARVLRPGGVYRMQWSNPFVMGMDERDWDERGYPLRHPYVDGAEVIFDDEHWDVEQPDGSVKRVVGPREFRHTLSGVVNTLAGHGFVIVHLMEETTQEADPTPGSWEHCKWIAPPWIQLWTRFLPQLVGV
jgi:SAM-dependent methyltransferase